MFIKLFGKHIRLKTTLENIFNYYSIYKIKTENHYIKVKFYKTAKL